MIFGFAGAVETAAGEAVGQHNVPAVLQNAVGAGVPVDAGVGAGPPDWPPLLPPPPPQLASASGNASARMDTCVRIDPPAADSKPRVYSQFFSRQYRKLKHLTKVR